MLTSILHTSWNFFSRLLISALFFVQFINPEVKLPIDVSVENGTIDHFLKTWLRNTKKGRKYNKNTSFENVKKSPLIPNIKPKLKH